MIREYLEQIEREARRAGIDDARLVAEISDHLSEASAAYRAGGRSRTEAETLAMSELGDPLVIVSSIAAIEGGVMRARTRLVGIGVGLAATCVVWLSHAVPSGDLARSPFATASLVALFAILGSVAVLMSTSNLALAIVGTVVVGVGAWAIAMSSASTLRIQVVSGGHMIVLLIAAVVFLVVGRLMRSRASAGLALVAAGVVSLVLNGAHENYGGIGEGQANLGLVLVTAGWLWVALSLGIDSWGQRFARSTRRGIAGWFEAAARGIAPRELDAANR